MPALNKMELQQLQDSQLADSREVATFSHQSCGSTWQAEEVEKRGNQTCDAVCQVIILSVGDQGSEQDQSVMMDLR